MLPDESIKEFRQIYKKVFKKEITSEETKIRAGNLTGLYNAVYGFTKKRKQ